MKKTVALCMVSVFASACQTEMNMTPNAVSGASPAGVEMIVAGVRARNPDAAALCRKGRDYIVNEVTIVATNLVVTGKLSSSTYPDGRKAADRIYGRCL